ncbi:hypothetical protein EK21DRAFT_112481 [Setomelanomma holmii]|uniref:Uncharacterized protein n=1 Tax=Setomelanomma holmii TaxID=210430 RepID=A0A9P4LND4_9PLEO|nr:hypothetical protein EK21DRAFT_112481 [Setomelanomma holmii]
MAEHQVSARLDHATTQFRQALGGQLPNPIDLTNDDSPHHIEPQPQRSCPLQQQQAVPRHHFPYAHGISPLAQANNQVDYAVSRESVATAHTGSFPSWVPNAVNFGPVGGAHLDRTGRPTLPPAHVALARTFQMNVSAPHLHYRPAPGLQHGNHEQLAYLSRQELSHPQTNSQERATRSSYKRCMHNSHASQLASELKAVHTSQDLASSSAWKQTKHVQRAPQASKRASLRPERFSPPSSKKRKRSDKIHPTKNQVPSLNRRTTAPIERSPHNEDNGPAHNKDNGSGHNIDKCISPYVTG